MRPEKWDVSQVGFRGSNASGGRIVLLPGACWTHGASKTVGLSISSTLYFAVFQSFRRHASAKRMLFLCGWYYPGMALQIWVCLICVISPYSNGAVQIRVVSELTEKPQSTNPFRRPRMSGRRMSGTSRRFPRHFRNCDFL